MVSNPQTRSATPAHFQQLELFFEITQPRETYADSDIEKVARLLRHCEPSAHTCPRTYIVLRRSGHLNILSQLLGAGFSDGWFPVEPQDLPSSLDPRIRGDIARCQSAIMTTSLDLEKGKHCHFRAQEPLPFEKLLCLGSGGFGKVYKVESKISYKEYALKIIHRRTAFGNSTRQAIAEFLGEMNIMRRLEHQHLVRYIGSYTDKQDLGLLMDPVADCDLAAYMNKAATSPDIRPTLKTFFGCLAAALSYLHQNSIRHRDIKPGNILVHRSVVLIADFGLSRDSLDTTSGPTPLTYRYCAPEVARQEKRNASADVWSLGCVFLEMMAALQDKSIDWLREYYGNVYTRSSHFYDNPAATELLLQEWERVLNEDEQKPVMWIRSMLWVDRQSRPTSAQLVEIVTESGTSMTYSGMCCGTDDGSDSIESLLDGLEIDPTPRPQPVETPSECLVAPRRERVTQHIRNSKSLDALETIEQPHQTHPVNMSNERLLVPGKQSILQTIRNARSFEGLAKTTQEPSTLPAERSLVPEKNHVLKAMQNTQIVDESATLRTRPAQTVGAFGRSPVMLKRNSPVLGETEHVPVVARDKFGKLHASHNVLGPGRREFAKQVPHADSQATPPPYNETIHPKKRSEAPPAAVWGLDLGLAVRFAAMDVKLSEFPAPDSNLTQPDVGLRVPIVVAQCVHFLTRHGTSYCFPNRADHSLVEEQPVIDQVCEVFNEYPDFGREWDWNNNPKIKVNGWPADITEPIAAKVLYGYLANLPEPVIPAGNTAQNLVHVLEPFKQLLLSQDLCDSSSAMNQGDQLGIYNSTHRIVESVLLGLDPANAELLYYLSCFFHLLHRDDITRLGMLEQRFSRIYIRVDHNPIAVSFVFRYLVRRSVHFDRSLWARVLSKRRKEKDMTGRVASPPNIYTLLQQHR